jgi:hypothetical protein
VRSLTFLRDDPRCQFWNIVDVTADALKAAKLKVSL